ncbi:hypothetical protein NEOLEDRAFT_1177890 [Neolentinus lepideus HHB14362 ss-1]|uniref:BZIP domain-containing protein n=1 Tax=Neolentinus lepideus HHB14362 ss-1 TaxID=1314782 RepID=A0A165T3F5_9AGAM|nr:hypothetical protein NEOLEDRAFT_1177890 [Neolentinus lepideus HHB14362 ss-1]
MTPSPSSSCAGNAQSPSGASERPERSRNAKAQARHRAKRKAYIEQLEQTVVKLQTIMNLSPEQVAALPPPSVRIRELEQENQRLHHELDRVRRQLEHKTLQLQQFAMDRRIAFPNVVDRDDSRDYKRRRMSGEGAYLSPTESPRPVHESASRPSLHLPLPVSHPNAAPSPHASSQHSAVPSSNSIYPLEVHPFQMPDTPSGSTASSPSVSASTLSLSFTVAQPAG